MRKTPKITAEEMATQHIDKANVSRANLDRAREVISIVSNYDDETAGKRAAGLYLFQVVEWLLDGLGDMPSIDSIAQDLQISATSAAVLYGLLAGAREQIATTRAYVIGGGKTSGNRRPKKQPMICPDIDDDDVPEDMRVPGGLFL